MSVTVCIDIKRSGWDIWTQPNNCSYLSDLQEVSGAKDRFEIEHTTHPLKQMETSHHLFERLQSGFRVTITARKLWSKCPTIYY